MKRKRAQQQQDGDDDRRLLGVTELARRLNNSDDDADNPRRAVLHVLQRFVRTVRRERRIALGIDKQQQQQQQQGDDELYYENDSSQDEGADDDVSGVEQEEESDNNKKKLRRRRQYRKGEAWKEDSANYNVPFVGTSTSFTSGDTGQVVVGEWPTGLLKAYLQSSPLAVEFTRADHLIVPPSSTTITASRKRNIHKSLLLLRNNNDTDKKKQQLSQAIYKAYLEALVELITAAIPKETLLLTLQQQRLVAVQNSPKDGNDDHNDKDTFAEHIAQVSETTTLLSSCPPPPPQEERCNRFLTELVQKRLPGLVLLLQEETGNGKGQKAANSSASVVGGGGGGVGVLAPCVLRILTALVWTSSSNVVPATALPRTILRSMENLPDGVLRLCLRPQNIKKRTTMKDSSHKSTTTTTTTTPRQEARVAALELTTALLYQNDPVIRSNISMPGNKERKVPPGILFLALQEGICMENNNIIDNDGSSNNNKCAAARVTAQLLRCVRQSLLLQVKRTQRPLFHPQLWSSRDYVQNLCHAAARAPPLSGNGDYPASFQDVLSGKDCYPDKLDSVEQARVEARRLLFFLLADSERSPLLESFRRARNEKSSSSTKNNTAEQVLVRAMNNLLEQHKGIELHRFLLYCVTETPTLLPALFGVLSFPDSRRIFAFIKQLSFVSRLVQHGPPVSSCVVSETVVSSDKKLQSERIIQAIVPLGLKKQHLSKAFQSSNALLASETLKLLIRILRRVEVYVRDKEEELVGALFDVFSRHMPDLQIVLATVSRFDMSKSMAGAIVTGYACEVIQALVTIFPEMVRSVHFDWVKLFPADIRGFCRAPELAQRKVLTCLNEVLVMQKVTSMFQPSSLRTLLEICMTTLSPDILKMTRGLVLHLLSCTGLSRTNDAESHQNVKYEYSCWIDGLSNDTLAEFCTLYNESTQNFLRGGITMAKAWKNAGLPGAVPELNVSALLVHSLLKLPRASKKFALLCCQVAAKCLLYHLNPLPLAATVDFVFQLECDHEDLRWPFFRCLAEYAKSLVAFEGSSQTDRVHLLKSMLKSLFPTKSDRSKKLASDLQRQVSSTELVLKNYFIEEDAVTLLRQVSHLFVISESRADKQRFFDRFRLVLPVVLKLDLTDEIWPFLKQMLTRFSRAPSISAESVDLVLRSSANCSIVNVDAFWLNCDAIAALSSCNGDDRLLTSAAQRSSLLYLYTVGAFVPEQYLSCWSTIFLKVRGHVSFSVVEKDLLDALVLSCLRRVNSSSETCLINDYNFPKEALGAWISLTEEADSDDMAGGQVLGTLEQILCRLLSQNDSMISNHVYLLFSGYSTREIVQRCLQAKRSLKASYRRGDSYCLLTALLKCDTVKYAPEIIGMFSSKKDRSGMLELLSTGTLDSTMSLVLAYPQTNKMNSRAVTEITETFMRRAIEYLADPISAKEQLDAVISILLSIDHQPEGALIDLYEELATTIKSLMVKEGRDITRSSVFSRLKSSQQGSVIQLVSKLCTRDADLFTTMVSHLLKHLPQSLQSFFENEGSSEAEALIKIEGIRDIILVFQQPDNSRMLKMDKVLLDGIDTCLQFGMKPASERTRSVQELLLLIAHLLVERIMNNNLSHHELDGQPVSRQLIDMIASHANFETLLNAPCEDKYIGVKLQVLRIMFLCVSTSKSVAFDKSIWKALLSGFDAGVTQSDTMIRRLLMVYPQHASKDMKEVSMDQFRWRGVRNVSDSGGGWEWLTDAVDLQRIYATVKNFPIDDKIIPDSLGKKLDNSIAADTQWTSMPKKDREGSFSKAWFDMDTTKEGLRYSPGFLLPLFLGALETDDDIVSESTTGPVDGVSGNNENHFLIEKVAKVRLAHELCSKGCVALALAALCSNHASVRRVAVSLLGRFVYFINSDEAREITSWRERPQIAMVLNAVQRALTIRMVEEGGVSGDVPKLPGLSAIFLARACLVLVSPGNNMFVAMNRYFLRNDVDHGAFQDLTRLPAFISLFCSSSDEPRQARNERLWAVKLVRDGFVDEECYRILAACHAPELLLSSCDNFWLHSSCGVEGELCLIQVTLLKIITLGGSRCESHLIGRLGLVYWLRSLLARRSLFEILGDLRSRLAFIRLTYIVISKAANVIPDEELRVTCACLAQPSLDFCLKTAKGDESARDDSILSDFVLTSCDLLYLLGRSACAKSPMSSSLVLQSAGISLTSVSDFLLIDGDRAHKRKALLAFCLLPVQPWKENETCNRFCVQALRLLIPPESASKELVLTVLHRISLLSSASDLNFVGDATSIIHLLFSLRSHCAVDEETREMWLECLSCFHEKCSNAGEECRLASAFLESNRQKKP